MILVILIEAAQRNEAVVVAVIMGCNYFNYLFIIELNLIYTINNNVNVYFIYTV